MDWYLPVRRSSSTISSIKFRDFSSLMAAGCLSVCKNTSKAPSAERNVGFIPVPKAVIKGLPAKKDPSASAGRIFQGLNVFLLYEPYGINRGDIPYRHVDILQGI